MTFSLELTDEQQAIVDVVTAIARSHVDPAARQAEHESEVPAEVWSAVSLLGLTSPVAIEHGGGGVPDVISQLVAVEHLAWGDPSIAAAIALSGAAASVVGAAGTIEQRNRSLPRFVDDPTARGACALYEGFGRAPSEYATSIERLDAGWRVRGTKVGVPFARTADLLVVIGREPGEGCLCAAILPAESCSVSVSEGALALHAVQMGTVSFDVVVDAEQVFSGPRLEVAISLVRLLPAALMIGLTKRACEYAADYARERIAFGRPIAAFQGVSFMLAEASTRIEAARLELWYAAMLLSPGLQSTSSIERAVSQAVNYAGEVATSVTRDAVQVLGGHGFIEDHPVERWYRAAAALSALDFDSTCNPFSMEL